MNLPRDPSMQDVARQAGVSVMTVSRVLRDDPRHSEEVRARVLDAVRGLGYRKNPLIAGLMSRVRRGKSAGTVRPTLALLHTVTQKGMHPNLQHFRDAVAARCDEHGCRLVKLPFLARGVSVARTMRIVRARGVDGLVIEHINAGDWDGRGDFDLNLTGMASVAIGLALREPRLHTIVTDDHANMQLALRRTEAAGRRRVGLIELEMMHLANRGIRTATMREWQSRWPVREQVPSLLVPEDTTIDAPVVRRWLQRHRPEVVLTTHLPLIRSYLSMRPRGVELVVLGWHPELPAGTVGVNPNWTEIGRVAVDELIGQIAHNEFGVPRHPRTILVSGTWVEGKSATA